MAVHAADRLVDTEVTGTSAGCWMPCLPVCLQRLASGGTRTMASRRPAAGILYLVSQLGCACPARSCALQPARWSVWVDPRRPAANGRSTFRWAPGVFHLNKYFVPPLRRMQPVAVRLDCARGFRSTLEGLLHVLPGRCEGQQDARQMEVPAMCLSPENSGRRSS